MIKITFIILILILTGSYLNYSSDNKFAFNLDRDDLFAFGPTPYPTLDITSNYSVSENKDNGTRSSGNIEVLSPAENDKVQSSFVVTGNARTKDNIVFIRLLDSSGNILIETTSEVNSPSSNSYGPFEKLITFNSKSASGKLDVFLFNNNDGTINDLVTIPLSFN